MIREWDPKDVIATYHILEFLTLKLLNHESTEQSTIWELVAKDYRYATVFLYETKLFLLAKAIETIEEGLR